MRSKCNWFSSFQFIYIVFILNNLAIGIDNKLKSNVYSTSHVKSSNNIVNQTNPPLTTYKAQQKKSKYWKARNDLWVHSFRFFVEDLSCSCSCLVRRFVWIKKIWRWIDNLVWATCLLQKFHMLLLLNIFLKSCQLHSNWAHASLGEPIRKVTFQIDF